MMNFFDSEENFYLVPPYLENKERIISGWKAQGLRNHIFICSSGTSSKGEIKTYALSKEALLTNAGAVNKFLNADKETIWLNSLPPYHVGGLSIFARCHLLGTKPKLIASKWSDEDSLIEANYFSVVPTQLYRMVKKSLRPPPGHQGVFVGGDFLASDLRLKARELGWKLIVTYGMTEVCSQLASSFVDENYDGFLDILPIHEVSVNGIKSESLYTSCIIFDDDTIEVFKAPLELKLQDKYELSKDGLRIKPLGRKDEYFNHKGKLYNKLQVLDSIQSILISVGALEEGQIKLEIDQEFGERPILCLSKNSLKKPIEELISQDKYLKSLSLEVREVDEIKKHSIGKIKNF